MKEIFLGEVIRRRRIELGLTQEALCVGICEPTTISRFENGRQTPSRNHVKALLFRLGLPDDRFFGLLSQREIEIEALQQEITNCHVLLQHSKTEQRCAIREDLLQKHQALRTLISPEDRLLQQFLLRSKYLMGTENGPYGLNKGMSLLTEAMRLTNPHFDLEHIGQSLYTSQEIKLINNMANCYMRANRHTEAVHILQQLLEYAQSHLGQLSYEKSHIPLITFNYALELKRVAQYAEAIRIAEYGQITSVQCGAYQLLPDLLAVLAESYFFLGEKGKSVDLYKQAFYTYKAFGNTTDLTNIKNDILRLHNLVLE